MVNLNHKNPISVETKVKLEEETSKSIQTISRLVDKVRNSIVIVENVNKLLAKQDSQLAHNKGEDEGHHLKRISEYTLLIGLIHLDISTAFRIYLNAKEPYEVIYSSKQLLITINEGYKKIYNYLRYENGIAIPTKRNQSYWVKDIGKLIHSELPELIPDYVQITKELDNYDDQELKNMVKPRNLSIHYDDNASEVYDMLINLDIETLTIKVLPFIRILNSMTQFSNTILQKYGELIEKRKNDSLEFHVNKLESIKVKNPEVADLLNDMQSWIKSFLK